MFVGTVFIQTHIPTAVQILVHGRVTIAQPAITPTLLAIVAASQMYFAQWICVQMAAQGILTTVAVLRYTIKRTVLIMIIFAQMVPIQTPIPANVHARMVLIQTPIPATVHAGMVLIQTPLPAAVPNRILSSSNTL